MYDAYRPPRPARRQSSRGAVGLWSALAGFGAGALATAFLVIAVGGPANDAGPDDEPRPAAAPASAPDEQGFTQEELDAQLAALAEEKDAEMADTVDVALEEAQATAQGEQDEAVARAVKQTRRAERARAREKVAAAVDAAVQEALAEQEPVGFADPPAASTDPRFSYCYEANDAGYGNYVQGVDPEYDWYDDADNDGVVCET